MSATPQSLLNLLEMARDRSSASRARIMETIGEFVVDGGPAPSERELELATDILRQLLREAEMSVRRKLAERLATEPAAPAALLVQLANDAAEVARPVLLESFVLRDADLLEIIEHQTLQHRLAISMRRQVSEEVTASLVEAGETEVARALLDNPGARFSHASFEKLVEKSRQERQLQEPLIHRVDLDPALATRMYAWVSEALRRYIVRHFDVDPELLDAAVRDSLESAAAEQRREQSAPSSLTPALDEAYAEDPGVLINLLRAGEVGLFEAMFARITGLQPRLARRAVYEPGGRALAVACRASGIEKPIFAAIFLLARRARPGDKTVDPRELPSVLAFFDSLDASTAKRTLDHLKTAADRRFAN